MARFIGNATSRTLAETVEKASGHLSDKEMPKATTVVRGNRFSRRTARKDEPEGGEASEANAQPASDEAQD
jgi:hypothetical protein